MNKYDLEFIDLIDKLGFENLKARLRVPRTIDIVSRKLGLEGYTPHTYKEITEACPVSEQRAKQIHQRARRIARGMFYNRFPF